MKDSLKPGMTVSREYSVDESRTIDFMGDDMRVYATPALVTDAEVTCLEFLLEHTEDGENSVGVSISVNHTAATPLGMTVTITATVVKIDGPRIDFEFTAHDGLDDVGNGKHSRFVVPVKVLEKRVREKIARFKGK